MDGHAIHQRILTDSEKVNLVPDHSAKWQILKLLFHQPIFLVSGEYFKKSIDEETRLVFYIDGITITNI